MTCEYNCVYYNAGQIMCSVGLQKRKKVGTANQHRKYGNNHNTIRKVSKIFLPWFSAVIKNRFTFSIHLIMSLCTSRWGAFCSVSSIASMLGELLGASPGSEKKIITTIDYTVTWQTNRSLPLKTTKLNTSIRSASEEFLQQISKIHNFNSPLKHFH